MQRLVVMLCMTQPPNSSCTKVREQHMARPPKLTPQQQKEAVPRRAQGAMLKELAKSYNVGVATISRLR
jgi:hypothetical protein